MLKSIVVLLEAIIDKAQSAVNPRIGGVELQQSQVALLCLMILSSFIQSIAQVEESRLVVGFQSQALTEAGYSFLGVLASIEDMSQLFLDIPVRVING
jgi:hypothetical protein